MKPNAQLSRRIAPDGLDMLQSRTLRGPLVSVPKKFARRIDCRWSSIWWPVKLRFTNN